MIPLRDTIPSSRRPVMTWIIIGLNLLFFLFELRLSPRQLEQVFYLFGVVPARYTNPQWAAWAGFPSSYWPFVTSMFLHGGWLHILGNMWVLWIFGDNVEDRMGPVRFLVFYLLCGLIAGVVQVLTSAHSTIPSVGASGAIAGVMGAYLIMFPRSRVLVLIPLLFIPLFFEVPAIFFLGFWFLVQLFTGTLALAGPQAVGGIAWWAHVGGFTSGILLFYFFLEPVPARPEPPEPPEPDDRDTDPFEDAMGYPDHRRP